MVLAELSLSLANLFFFNHSLLGPIHPLLRLIPKLGEVFLGDLPQVTEEKTDLLCPWADVCAAGNCRSPHANEERKKMKELNEFIAGLHTGEPVEFNRLKIRPIFVDEDRKLPFLDLEEALKQGFIEITEISEGGSVPDLEVSNKSHEDVIILDGEELIGAKQNRIVNTTIVVAATSKLKIPVSCVEQRRWRYSSPSFSASKSRQCPACAQETNTSRPVCDGKRATGRSSAIWSALCEDDRMASIVPALQ